MLRLIMVIKWLIKRVISSGTEVNKWNNNFIDFVSVFNPPVQKLPKCLENFIKKQYKVLYNSSSSIVSSAARGQAKGQYEGNNKSKKKLFTVRFVSDLLTNFRHKCLNNFILKPVY